MLQIIYRNKLVFFIYFCLLSIALFFFISEGKINSHLIINSWHSPLLDDIFATVTYLGDGIFAFSAAIVVLIFISVRQGAVIITALAFSSLLVQFLKRVIFSSLDRPVSFFHNLGTELYRIQSYEYHSHFSFPSGHSASAFALFMGFALFSRNNACKIVFLLIASLIAFSRTYLSQHFIIDIIAGSLVGTTVVLATSYFFSSRRKPWPDQGLVKFKRVTDE